MTADSNQFLPANEATGAWFVVAAKPRQELEAERQLKNQGFEVLLPQLALKKRRGGKWQSVVEPMFPGYLFVQLVVGRDDPAPIRSTIGCRGLVRFGQEYVPVPTTVITPLLGLGREPVTSEVGFKPGDVVRLEQGPFAGLTAVFHMQKGEDRARVLINLLGKAREIAVPLDDLSKE